MDAEIERMSPSLLGRVRGARLAHPDPSAERAVTMDFTETMGMHSMHASDGVCRIELEISPLHLSMAERVHGGVFFTMLDTALGPTTDRAGLMQCRGDHSATRQDELLQRLQLRVVMVTPDLQLCDVDLRRSNYIVPSRILRGCEIRTDVKKFALDLYQRLEHRAVG